MPYRRTSIRIINDDERLFLVPPNDTGAVRIHLLRRHTEE